MEHTSHTINLLSFAFWRCSLSIGLLILFFLSICGLCYRGNRSIYKYVATHRTHETICVLFFLSSRLGCILLIDPYICIYGETIYRSISEWCVQIYAINSLIFNFRLRFKWILVPFFFISFSLHIGHCVSIALNCNCRNPNDIAASPNYMNSYKFQNEIRNIIKWRTIRQQAIG